MLIKLNRKFVTTASQRSHRSVIFVSSLISIGAISYMHPPESVEHAVRAADALMYTVKRSGKNNLMHTTSG